MPKVKKQRVFKKSSVPYAPPYIPAVSGFANTGEGPAPNFVAQDPGKGKRKQNNYVNPLFIKGKKKYVSPLDPRTNYDHSNPFAHGKSSPDTFMGQMGDDLFDVIVPLLPMLPFLL